MPIIEIKESVLVAIGKTLLVLLFKATDISENIKEPTITPFERKGFTVVEWGGTIGG